MQTLIKHGIKFGIKGGVKLKQPILIPMELCRTHTSQGHSLSQQWTTITYGAHLGMCQNKDLDPKSKMVPRLPFPNSGLGVFDRGPVGEHHLGVDSRPAY